jgi:two-component sensor histidine kinase
MVQRALVWTLPVATAVCLAAAIAVGWREYESTTAIAQMQFLADVDSHAATLKDRLNERETVARAVAAAITPPPGIDAGALAGVDPSILQFVPDVVSFVWVPRVPPGHARDVVAALRRSGVENPVLFGEHKRPLTQEELAERLYPVIDVLPPTDANRSSLGLNLWARPLAREALLRAETSKDVAGTAPIELVQLPGVKSIVLYVPVVARGDQAASVTGFIGFSYRHDSLFEPETGPGRLARLAAVVDSAVAEPVIGSPATDGEAIRQAVFGGRPFQLAYSRATDPRPHILARSLAASAISAAILGLVLAIAAYLLRVSRQLETALAGRTSAEERLRVVVSELSHRIKNVFAVAQSIANQTIRGIDADGSARAALAGRLQSMAQATALLSEGEWRGASLREVVAGLGLPFADRVRVYGEDFTANAAATQSLVLLVHELWTNAAKYGALATENGTVDLVWRFDGGRFELTWVENGGGSADLPERQGFGRQLIERLVPQQLSGEAALEATPEGVRFRISAPRENVEMR